MLGERDRIIELLKSVANMRTMRKSLSECADFLLENGVTRPPCKIGDTVYTNFAMQGWYFRSKDRPYSAKVVFVGLNDSEEMGGGFINVVYGKHDYMMQFRFSDIGKRVFLTREEAEEDLNQNTDNSEKE